MKGYKIHSGVTGCAGRGVVVHASVSLFVLMFELFDSKCVCRVLCVLAPPGVSLNRSRSRCTDYSCRLLEISDARSCCPAAALTT